MRLTKLLFLAIMLSGCAKFMPQSDSVSAAPDENIDIDVFLARGFLGGSDFERYHLQGDLLWRECGGVNSAGARPTHAADGDAALSQDPNLSIEERRVETLTAAQLKSVQEAAHLFLERLNTSSGQLPGPGSVFGLTSPGLAELKMQIGSETKHVLTEVDALSNPQESSATAAYKFLATLRGVGPVICRSKSFFGIKRLEF